MIPLLLSLLLQTGQWTVTPPEPTIGDTVVLERVLTEPLPGVEARVDAIEASEGVEPLRPPEVRYGEAGIVIRHTVAVFRRQVDLVLPDIDLIFPDGSIETLSGGSATVAVQSVLPAADTLPEPRWSQPPVQRRVTAVTYPVLFTALAVTFAVGWGVVRRRTRPIPQWPGPAPRRREPPLTRWISCGEPRAVAAWTAERVRDRLGELVPQAGPALDVEERLAVLRRERPEWPHRELADLLHALERASFAPAIPSDVLAVADDVDELLRRLEGSTEDETD